MILLVGLVGVAGSGKTTIANYLQDKHGFCKMSFADPLKEMLLNAKMCSYDELYRNKTTMSRWLMQKIGTEIFRNQVDSYFWVHKAFERIRQFHLEHEQSIVFDDIRFPEEARLVKTLGGMTIKVIREDYKDPVAGTDHDSERLISEIVCDFTITAKSGDTAGLLSEVEGLSCLIK